MEDKQTICCFSCDPFTESCLVYPFRLCKVDLVYGDISVYDISIPLRNERATLHWLIYVGKIEC